METRFLLRVLQRMRSRTIPSRSSTRHSSSSSKPLSQQANPIGDYYASILESSSSNISSKPPTTANPSSAPSITGSTESPPPASLIFSSRILGPLEREAEKKKNSTLVAGILVPQRPDEPDNCCMSGCVNCVWDRYGEELEEWAAKRKEADVALKLQKAGELEGKKVTQPGMGDKVETPAVSMDDDGGGSESNWGTGLESGFTSDDLFKGVPVGIREFMKQEKKLKERHAREGTRGG